MIVCRNGLDAENAPSGSHVRRKPIVPMADASSSWIGKYRIIELVGEGAMGVVYRAQDSVLDRTVAIKVMNESIARQDDLRKRFLHEAQAAGSLQHPNVVCIYDLGEADGHLFIAMEFIQGVDLERLIELGEPLSLQARLDIIIDVLTGLAFAHKRGIVHRDIKPANIRVGEDGRAKIMDFGVAHLASSSMTSTGSILGTPTYMAPEQITEGKTSPATDIFAVGAVLYQLLASMRPFEAPILQNLLFKIVTENPRPLSELMPGLPPALDHIVQKAMAKDPAQRYSNALDMANDLTSVRSKLSGPSYPASVSLSASIAGAFEQSRKTSRRRATKFAFMGGGAIAAISVIAMAWSKFPQSPSPNPDFLDKLAAGSHADAAADGARRGSKIIRCGALRSYRRRRQNCVQTGFTSCRCHAGSAYGSAGSRRHRGRGSGPDGCNSATGRSASDTSDDIPCAAPNSLTSRRLLRLTHAQSSRGA